MKEEAHARALVDRAVNQFGGLDIAFNNAGSSGEMAPVPDLSVAGWRDTIDTNLTSAFLGAKYQVPAMIERGSGSIVFTSSFVGNTVGSGHERICRRQGGDRRLDADAGC